MGARVSLLLLLLVQEPESWGFNNLPLQPPTQAWRRWLRRIKPQTKASGVLEAVESLVVGGGSAGTLLEGSRERDSFSKYGNLTLELSRLLTVPNPSYVQILKDRILSITSFSLLRKGAIIQYDLAGTHGGGGLGGVGGGGVEPRVLHGDYLWPNELSQFVDQSGHTVTLVPDGFLLPGQNDGGLYAIVQKNGKGGRGEVAGGSRPIRITASKPGWFHHKAVHVRLPGGNEGILTARARKPLFGPGKGELVWLAVPPRSSSDVAWHSSISVAEGEEDDDGSGRQIDMDTALEAPWEETVLAEGPDVMFEVTDLDPSDDTIQVIAAHFFGSQLSIHSLRASSRPPFVDVVDSRVIDTAGRPYGLCLAAIKPPAPATGATASTSAPPHTHLLVSTHECAYDVPSALSMVLSALRGSYPTIKAGAGAWGWDRSQGSHEQFRRGERFPVEAGSRAGSSESEAGGALYAYELPLPASSLPASADATHQQHHHQQQQQQQQQTRPSLTDMQLWPRHTLFRGFKVRGWGGIFSPGAPGFPYVFNLPSRPNAPPLILLAGDCTGSAYIFSPTSRDGESGAGAGAGVRGGECEGIGSYELAFEIECGATVGSAAVLPAADSSGHVEIVVPSYELNKVHFFRLRES